MADHWTHKWRFYENQGAPNNWRCAKCGCVSTSIIARDPCVANPLGLRLTEIDKNWGWFFRVATPIAIGMGIGFTLLYFFSVILNSILH